MKLGPIEITGWHQWSSFTPGCQWRDFDAIHLGGELTHYAGRVSVTACLLGLWVDVTWHYATKQGACNATDSTHSEAGRKGT